MMNVVSRSFASDVFYCPKTSLFFLAVSLWLIYTLHVPQHNKFQIQSNLRTCQQKESHPQVTFM